MDTPKYILADFHQLGMNQQFIYISYFQLILNLNLGALKLSYPVKKSDIWHRLQLIIDDLNQNKLPLFGLRVVIFVYINK